MVDCEVREGVGFPDRRNRQQRRHGEDGHGGDILFNHQLDKKAAREKLASNPKLVRHKFPGAKR